MKLALQLAYKNLVGAGLRTWLNAIVLSFAFIVIILYNGLIDGWNQQAINDGINWEWGYGHLLNENYDPFDPFTIQDGYGEFKDFNNDNLTPVLIRQGNLYPHRRMMPIYIKGIDVNQAILKLPTELLKHSDASYPVIIGKQMSESAKVKVGDKILLRWRDKNETYDATTVTVVGIFDTNVPFIDRGQIWMSIKKLREMTLLKHKTTYFIANEKFSLSETVGWEFQSQQYLMREQLKLINTKKISGSILYIILMTLGLLAIFDTQALSIFRRQKEIGTFIALGMTRWQVVRMFTAEGAMYSVLATLLGSLYGFPLLWYLSITGIGFEISGSEFGMIMAETIFPVFSLELIIGTVIIVIFSATIVSFLPARKIAKMNPIDALKGKVS